MNNDNNLHPQYRTIGQPMATNDNRLVTILPAFPDTKLLLVIYGKHGEPVDFMSEPILAWLVTAELDEDSLCFARPITFSSRIVECKEDEYAVEHPDGSCGQSLVTCRNRAELLEFLVEDFRRTRRLKRRLATPDAA
jgi:hypothetical protein